MKILYIPFSVLGGILAGAIAKKSFEQIWALIDKEDPPEPDQRSAQWKKLIAALILEGAIYRAVRGLFDRGSRELFVRFTGSWPGDE